MRAMWFRALGGVAVGLLVASSASADRSSRRLTGDDLAKNLYNRHCAACHGPRAKGDGPAAAALSAPVPDLSKGVAEHQIAPFVKVVLQGRGVMPGFALSIDASEAEVVLRYLERLGGQPDEAARKAAPRRGVKPPPVEPDEADDEAEAGGDE